MGGGGSLGTHGGSGALGRGAGESASLSAVGSGTKSSSSSLATALRLGAAFAPLSSTSLSLSDMLYVTAAEETGRGVRQEGG